MKKVGSVPDLLARLNSQCVEIACVSFFVHVVYISIFESLNRHDINSFFFVRS